MTTVKTCIWRVAAVLAFAITPPAQARELVLAQGAQVDQYLAAESAIKTASSFVGHASTTGIGVEPKYVARDAPTFGGADQVGPRGLSQIFLVCVRGKRQSKFCNGYHVDHAERSAVALYGVARRRLCNPWNTHHGDACFR